MKSTLSCLVIGAAVLAAASDQGGVTYVDPGHLEKWQLRLDRAEGQLVKRQWSKADKLARTAAEDIVNGSRLGHEIDPLLARASAIRAVAAAMAGQTRLARWHWQVAQILTSRPPELDLGPFGERAAFLADVRPRNPDEPPPGARSWDEVKELEVKALRSPHPDYSRESRRVGIQARLTFGVILGGDGKLSEPCVYDKQDMAVFYYPILVALPEWEFEPLVFDGRPTAAEYILTFYFNVDER